MPARLRGSEGAAVSGKNLDSIRAGIVRACWSRKLSMATPYAVLALLNIFDGCDPAFYVIWERCRQMRWYLGYRLGELQRV